MEIVPSNGEKLPFQKRYRDNRTGVTVGKAVQTWFDDITYSEKEISQKTNAVDSDLMYRTKPLSGPYSYTVVNRVMVRIPTRIGMVIQFNVTQRHASSLPNHPLPNYKLRISRINSIP